MKPALLFIYAEGCPACEAAKPELEKFRRAYPQIFVRGYDLTKPPGAGGWPHNGGWQPTATPTYLATFANRQPVGYVGTMTHGQLTKFMRMSCEKLGLPPAV